MASHTERPWRVAWDEVESPRHAEGGQGSVIQVLRRTDSRLGALKILHPNSLRDRERRARMAREVNALKRMPGAGIPEVLDENMEHADAIDQPLYFVMDWIEGPTLQMYAGGSPKQLSEAIEITTQLAGTIQRCHEAGVLHRDIKPDNAIINRVSGGITLVDFGISWVEDPGIVDNVVLTEVGQELGNRFLRIPELAPGGARHDRRTDITFVVGVLFFLLTGRAPRVLLNERSQKPHEALRDAFPESVLADPRWDMVRRIFHVGFQPSVDLRFRSAGSLLQRLRELADRPEQKYDPIKASDTALANFKELLSSEIAKSFLLIEKGMLEASQKLENRLEEMARSAGLRSVHYAGRSRVGSAGRAVEFAYHLAHTRAHEPYTHMYHLVQLVGDDRSIVRAGYKITSSLNEDNGWRWYYEGPAADVDRLQEEMLARADEIFAECINEVNMVVESAVRRAAGGDS